MFPAGRDLVTPLCSPTAFWGLFDDVVGIQSGEERIFWHSVSLSLSDDSIALTSVHPISIFISFLFLSTAHLSSLSAMSSQLTGGAVANRLRRRTSDQTVLGSNPAVAAALSPWTRLFTPIVPRRSLHISFY